MTIQEFFQQKQQNIEEPFSYYNSQWVEWMEEYLKVNSMELLTFLANIEAWLSFNQEPTKIQLKELKNDIVKLLEKHNFDYDR
jgi:hypothetical protein